MINSKFMLSTAAAIGAIMSISAASAADFGAVPYAKAPAFAAVGPVTSWAGFYAGPNAGVVWAHSDITDSPATPSRRFRER